jgi:hypothetical protein
MLRFSSLQRQQLRCDRRSLLSSQNYSTTLHLCHCCLLGTMIPFSILLLFYPTPRNKHISNTHSWLFDCNAQLHNNLMFASLQCAARGYPRFTARTSLTILKASLRSLLHLCCCRHGQHRPPSHMHVFQCYGSFLVIGVTTPAGASSVQLTFTNGAKSPTVGLTPLMIPYSFSSMMPSSMQFRC